jgi:4-aminobutyrate aminotransferase / (S)-3-amino-2-methylpropionate transaminase / 5-aminovalerate transaminase
MITPYVRYVEVCELLAELTPGDHAKKSALFNSGAEAVENAIKIARVATGCNAIVAFDHAYHGRTNLTMALTARTGPTSKASGRSPARSIGRRCPTRFVTDWTAPRLRRGRLT